MARLTERNPLLEGDSLALQGSPRFDYGPIGELVHPGPTFSEADERAGLGKAGEPVPGLARLCDSIGRFGLFGAMNGSSPDGTLLLAIAALAFFGATIKGLGLAPSIFGAGLLSALASRQNGPLSALAIAAALTLLCLAVFHYGLGLSVPVLGPWLGG